MLTIISENLNSETVQTCNAEDLHTKLEIDKDISVWLSALIEDYKLVEGEDFIISDGSYHLSLETAKLFATISSTETGRKVRQYFIACEKDMKNLLLKRAEQQAQQIKTLEQEKLTAYKDLDTQLAIRNVNEEYELAQEFLTAYLAECKALNVKPVSVLSKQRAYIKDAIKFRKAHAKRLQQLIDDGIINGKSLGEIREDLSATSLAYAKPQLKNLTLSKIDLMKLT